MIDKQKMIIDAANDVVEDIAAFLALFHTEEIFEAYSSKTFDRDYAGLKELVSEEHKNFETLLRLLLASDFSIFLTNKIKKYVQFSTQFTALLKESI